LRFGGLHARDYRGGRSTACEFNPFMLTAFLDTSTRSPDAAPMILLPVKTPSGQSLEPMHPGSIPELAIALGRQLSTNSLRDQCLNLAVDSHRTVVESGSEGKIKGVQCHTVSRSNRPRIHWVFAQRMHGARVPTPLAGARKSAALGASI